MPDSNRYDMDFRPETYWGFDEHNAHIGATVKGELRRNVAMELANDGILDPMISVESLSDEQRQTAGSVHPWFMGGEYLPDLLPGEVEIARVTLESVTMDVISIRARRTKHRIKYRIVDEYCDDPMLNYQLIQKTSLKPLTMRQLVRLIDNAQEHGLDGEARHWNYINSDGDAEGLYDFATITSEFYPELQPWYEEANEEWLDQELERIRG